MGRSPRPWQVPVDALLRELGSGTGGPSGAEAGARLARLGPNELPERRGRPAAARFLGQITHFMALLLWGGRRPGLRGPHPAARLGHLGGGAGERPLQLLAGGEGRALPRGPPPDDAPRSAGLARRPDRDPPGARPRAGRRGRAGPGRSGSGRRPTPLCRLPASRPLGPDGRVGSGGARSGAGRASLLAGGRGWLGGARRLEPGLGARPGPGLRHRGGDRARRGGGAHRRGREASEHALGAGGAARPGHHHPLGRHRSLGLRAGGPASA